VDSEPDGIDVSPATSVGRTGVGDASVTALAAATGGEYHSTNVSV
jgi:hypothetical protein